LGVALESQDIDTLSGMVVTTLGRNPRVGDLVEFETASAEVLDVEENCASKLRLKINK
jgi:CBS domain containing-hemolysin-like protein